MTALRGEDLRRFRRKIQLVYQNPFASLDPRQTVRAILAEPPRNFERLTTRETDTRVRAIIERVHLAPEHLDRKPAALSGASGSASPLPGR
ncbi:hypothetical protein QPR87_01530 [Paracoccus sp. SSJ]|nr:hypothetical protein [Paracoccus sp. SSJ]MDK8871296.1 hypothetical protein [Paracoccus sp. SSJ]